MRNVSRSCMALLLLAFAANWMLMLRPTPPPGETKAQADIQVHDIQGCLGGNRTSKDAIVMMIQKHHSTYGGHTVDISGPLLSLKKAYPQVHKADILLWHEGDFTWNDIPTDKFKGMNVRLCNLNHAEGVWGPRPNASVPNMQFSVGYRNMIRFYAVTIWNVLSDLGYEYVMRLDDDSNFMSPIQYNLFDALRSQDAVYGYRQESRECDNGGFGGFVDQYVTSNQIVPKFGALDEPYCNQMGQYGYYSNFFVSRIAWWQQPQVAHFIQTFDESNLIYKKRCGDLVFQTAALKLFAKPREVLKYVDWSYAHVTVNNGDWAWGGVSFGTEDPRRNTRQKMKAFQKWMADRWGIEGPQDASLLSVDCNVTNRLCGVSSCRKSGEHGIELLMGRNTAGYWWNAPSLSQCMKEPS
ncbi:glycosyltransferase family 15 protein [Seminavis robusta]|uniref:Glycosyltransferase family 15 protein n=1 Tax=Seminavis robusta TaxID=568900 RepID=A0A9N8HPZ8_9STRA|nr:glycosyltransferase family 15 protein [Seminavis robusta]|eukprot:Sro1383_g268000.1 glycosyltransferase family 15 protein (410) ;mRNA; r:16452-17681